MDALKLPVLRRLIIPEPGMTLLDLDLSAADAQIVAWDSGDELLKKQLRTPNFDLYTETDSDLWRDPRLPKDRGLRKNCVHSADYGASYKTIADKYIGDRSVAKNWLARWFRLHPSIKAWQRRVQFDLERTREVKNVWGFRRVYTDRLDPTLLHQALAWIGQSTVAITINKILLRIDAAEQRSALPCWILLQDHDNLVMQCPTSELETVATEVLRLSRVPIPFPDPLTIPAALKASSRSWADVKTVPTFQGVPFILDEHRDTSPTGSPPTLRPSAMERSQIALISG